MGPERRGEVTRLEAFSDAVFAISATLLVVSLEVPKTFPELVVDLKGFVTFALGTENDGALHRDMLGAVLGKDVTHVGDVGR